MSSSSNTNSEPNSPPSDNEMEKKWGWYPALLNYTVEKYEVPDDVPEMRDSWKKTFAGYVSYVQDKMSDVVEAGRKLELVWGLRDNLTYKYSALEERVNTLTNRLAETRLIVEEQQEQIQLLMANQQPPVIPQEEQPEEEPEEEPEEDPEEEEIEPLEIDESDGDDSCTTMDSD